MKLLLPLYEWLSEMLTSAGLLMDQAMSEADDIPFPFPTLPLELNVGILLFLDLQSIVRLTSKSRSKSVGADSTRQ